MIDEASPCYHAGIIDFGWHFPRSEHGDSRNSLLDLGVCYAAITDDRHDVGSRSGHRMVYARDVSTSADREKPIVGGEI